MTHEEGSGLTHVLDQLNQVSHLNEAAFMAALDLPDDDRREAMRALLDLISNKIDGAKSDLDKIRNKESEMGLCCSGEAGR
jgi:hypothetical protein